MFNVKHFFFHSKINPIIKHRIKKNILKRPNNDKEDTPNNQGKIKTNSASKNRVECVSKNQAPLKHSKIIIYHYA